MAFKTIPHLGILAVVASIALVGCPTNPPDGSGGGGNPGGGSNTPPALVYINEFSAHEANAISDEDGESSDWIELFNAGSGATNLAGWSLSDDPALPRKWTFPNVVVEPGDYLVVFASGKDRREPGGALHTNFKLDKDGEYLGLVNLQGDPVAHSEFAPAYPPQYDGLVFGRTAKVGTFLYRDHPTPGQVNTGGSFAEPIVFSHAGGFHDEPIALAIQTAQPGVALRYTLDGTVPRAPNGAVYSGPLDINQNTSLRVATFRDGLAVSPVRTRTFIIAVDAAQPNLPVIALTGDPQESLYEPNGIMAIVGGHYEEVQFGFDWVSDSPTDYNNPIQHGMDFERPVSLEFYDTNTAFQVDCGIRIQGSNFHRRKYFRADDWLGCPSGGPNYAKFSFRLAFRAAYGPTILDHALLPLRPEAGHDQIVLRGGHNDSCDPFIRDELCRRLYHDMGHVSSLGTLASLYINGDYKGVYNPVERIDEKFLQAQHNSALPWDVILQGSEARDGDTVEWDAFLAFIGSTDLGTASNYVAAAQQLDVDNFIDYLILELYTNNTDWPNNNWIAARERSPQGRWRFYVWDSELAFLPHRLENTALHAYPFPNGRGLGGEATEIPQLYRALAANPTFRARFAERVSHHFAEGGALHPANLHARHEELWNTAVQALPGINTFIPDEFIPAREAILLQALREEGLYP